LIIYPHKLSTLKPTDSHNYTPFTNAYKTESLFIYHLRFLEFNPII